MDLNFLLFRILNFKDNLQRDAIPLDSIGHSFSGVASLVRANKMLDFNLLFQL